jgi:hypothetical protein
MSAEAHAVLSPHPGELAAFSAAAEFSVFFRFQVGLVAESVSERIGLKGRFPSDRTCELLRRSRIRMVTHRFITVLFQEPVGSSDGCFEFGVPKP